MTSLRTADSPESRRKLVLELKARVDDLVFSTDVDRSIAEKYVAQCDTHDSLSVERAIALLEELLRQIETRSEVQERLPAKELDPGTSIYWDRASLELDGAEKRWQRLASVQFWVGISTAPIAV